MTLENTLHQKLSEWRPAPGRRLLSVADADAGWTVELTTDRADAVGCLVWEVALRRSQAAPAGENLRGWADRAAARTTGLLESLKVHEIDATRNEGVLRSSAPAERGDNLFYYELFLKGTSEAVLRRFQAPRTGGGKRQQVAFALTHEALAKVAGDLTAVK